MNLRDLIPAVRILSVAALAGGLPATAAAAKKAARAPEPAVVSGEAAPRYRFVPITSVVGSLPLGNPWSPAQPLLVYNEGAQVPSFRAIDLSEKSPEPWELVDALVQSADWSPDGTWLAAEVVENSRRSARTLIALPAAREAGEQRPIEALAAGSGTVRFLWGRDGIVWYLPDTEPEAWLSVEAPESWRTAHPEPFPPATQFIVHDGPWTPENPTFRIYLVETGANGLQERLLPMPVPIAGSMSLVDAFPDRTRVLAQIFPFGAAAFAAVVDLDGHVIALFESEETPLEGDGLLQSVRTSFNPQTVSGDGSLVVGTRTVEDGHQIGQSTLYVGDAEGRWNAILEDAPEGAGPRLSRSGDFLVFANSATRLLEIGRIQKVK